MNDFINDDNVTLSIFFKKFVFDLIFDREIYDVKKA